MTRVRFKAELRESRAGSGGHLIEVPDDVVEKVGGKGRIPVRVTFDGVPCRGSIVRYDGSTMIGVTKAVMAEAGASVGDTLTVVAENDDAPREVDVPEDLSKALRSKRLTKAWEELSFTRRRELASAVAGAKRPETRQRRVDQAVAETSAKRG
ncbi:MAG: YdeI/OmpD-associated family protein [Actinomycetota bacterium]